MPKLITLLLFMLFVVAARITQAQPSEDYSKYHQAIIKAEEQIFVKNKIAEGLKTYSEAFAKYDFVFLNDCFTAMQIALYANDPKVFLAFVDKATKNGLMPRHIELGCMKYIQTHPIYLNNKEKVLTLCRVNRQHYLKRIDTGTLFKLIKLYSYTQLSKNRQPTKTGPETQVVYKRRFKPIITDIMLDLQAIINKKGIPSDKTVGIDQPDIMHELKMGGIDALDYYNKNKDNPKYYAATTQFMYDEHYFSSTMYLIIINLYVKQTTGQFAKRSFTIYPDSFFLRQIKAGNMHPKDVAYLYDYPWRLGTPQPDTSRGEKYFHCVKTLIDDRKPDWVSTKTINYCRSLFFIAPLENDLAKFRFMHEHGMYIGCGYEGCRS